jgi:hypothetical protein
LIGAFRDAKSTEFGFSMNENKTIKADRYIVWLMLATLASLIAWIVGYAAEQKSYIMIFKLILIDTEEYFLFSI